MKGTPFIPSADGKEVQLRCDTCGSVLTMDKEALRAWLESRDLELVVPREDQ